MHVQKVNLNKQEIQKNCVPEFSILLIPKNYLHVYLWFLEENCAIALDSCYLFTKKTLNMELNMILLMEFE